MQTILKGLQIIGTIIVLTTVLFCMWCSGWVIAISTFINFVRTGSFDDEEEIQEQKKRNRQWIRLESPYQNPLSS